jgi:hypothetical protein
VNDPRGIATFTINQAFAAVKGFVGFPLSFQKAAVYPDQMGANGLSRAASGCAGPRRDRTCQPQAVTLEMRLFLKNLQASGAIAGNE